MSSCCVVLFCVVFSFSVYFVLHCFVFVFFFVTRSGSMIRADWLPPYRSDFTMAEAHLHVLLRPRFLDTAPLECWRPRCLGRIVLAAWFHLVRQGLMDDDDDDDDDDED